MCREKPKVKVNETTARGAIAEPPSTILGPAATSPGIGMKSFLTVRLRNDEKLIERLLNIVERESWLHDQLLDLYQPTKITAMAAVTTPGIDSESLRKDRALRHDRCLGDHGDLRRYLILELDSDIKPSAVRESLQRSADVELSYFFAGLSLTGSQATGKDLDLNDIADERHLQAIGAPYAWSFPGGDGMGLRLVDLEGGWFLEHGDLVDAAVTLASGRNDESYSYHGTAVLGILAAARNRRATTGIVPNISALRVVSVERFVTGAPDGGRETRIQTVDAIAAALRELRYGDVLLVELEAPAIEGSPKRPYELEPAIFDALRLATAMGIVVVEPAGNGRAGVDDLTTPDGRRVLDRLSPDFQDSGAIIVGASERSFPYYRLASSNFGKRIDCFAFGRKVLTTGILQMLARKVLSPHQLAQADDPGELLLREIEANPATLEQLHEEFASDTYLQSVFPIDQHFGHTSAASAIVAGAAVAVQGLAQAHLGYRLSPWQVRLILSDPDNGTPSGDPQEYPIGVMPDLREVIDEVLNIPADLYIRDHVGDDGGRPRARVSASPDIIVRNEKVDSPQEAFGEESGTDGDPWLSAAVKAGEECFVYLRLRNRGGKDRYEVKAKIYSAPAAAFLSPALWHEVGTAVVPAVLEADVPAVSAAIEWIAVEGATGNRRAWIALVGDDRQAAPGPEDFSTWERMRELLHHSNDYAQRNLHRVEHRREVNASELSAWVELPFLAPGFPKEDRTMRLEVISRLPKACQVWLEMPEEIADLRPLEPPPLDGLAEDRIYLPVNPSGRHYFREAVFASGSAAHLRFLVYVPEAFRRHVYRIAVRQLCEGEEIGRVTWYLVCCD